MKGVKIDKLTGKKTFHFNERPWLNDNGQQLGVMWNEFSEESLKKELKKNPNKEDEFDDIHIPNSKAARRQKLKSKVWLDLDRALTDEELDEIENSDLNVI